MKNLFAALITLFSLTFISTNSFASHVSGGELTWECQGNGMFVFHLKIVRDCQGVQVNYVNLTMNVSHSASNSANIPKDANNANISSITLKPDSAKWLAKNNGFQDPYCKGNNGYSCSSGDGTTQVHYYKSDPIQIKGTPNSAGWHFTHHSFCCRSNASNINSNGNLSLRSSMYRIEVPNSNPVQYYSTDACRDNSPQFAEDSYPQFCRGTEYRFANGALDVEADSLVYKQVEALQGSNNQVQTKPFNQGYSIQNPLPGTAIDPSNGSIVWDGLTGDLNFEVNGGSGIQSYALPIQVEAYRNGNKIASVRKEMKVIIRDCAPLTSTTMNSPPKLMENGNEVETIQASVNVGQTLNLALSITDTDINNSINPPTQEIILSAYGNALSENLSATLNCNLPPCATMTPTPSLDSLNNRYQIKGQASVGASFNWSPGITQLDANGGAKTHYFHLNVQDDHCPMPGISYKTLAITVFPLGTNLEEENSVSNNFSIFPNPNNGTFSVIARDNHKIQNIKLIDAKGSVILEKAFSVANKVVLNEDVPVGLYFVELLHEDGSLARQKMIVQ